MPLLKPLRGAQLNRSHPLARGLVGYWLMNGGSGNKIYDLSGNKNEATNTYTFWIGGSTGYALAYNGTNAKTENTAMKNVGSGIGTIVGRMRINTAGNYKYLFSALDSGNNCALYLRQRDTNELHLVAYNTGGTLVVNGATGDGHFTVGQWYDWTLAWDSSAMYLYENGQVVLSDTDIAGTIRNTDQIGIGVLLPNTAYCHMDCEFLFVYNRMLSASESTQLYIDPFCMMERGINPALLYVSGEAGLSIPVAMRTYRNRRIA